MRCEWTQRFDADFRKLNASNQETFRSAAREFSEAADRFAAERSPWPARLRVRGVESARGVFEMTWSFAGPDGRATWEWTAVDRGGARHPAIRWRRVGDHSIFKSPVTSAHG